MATENDVDEQITASDPFTGHVEVEQEPLEQVEEVPEGTKPVAKEPTAITPETLADAIKAAFPAKDEPKPVPVEPKKLSPEEYEAMYKVWKPSSDFHQRLTSSDPVIANKALIEMRDGQVQQAVTMAYHIVQELMKPVQERVGSVESTAQSMAAERSREKFISSYPELSEHTDILKMVSDQLVSSGFKPKTEKEAHEKIAQTTEKLLQTVNPTFKLGGQKQTQQQNKSTTKPKMVATSRGGQGGAGGGGGDTKTNVPKGMDIFD